MREIINRDILRIKKKRLSKKKETIINHKRKLASIRKISKITPIYGADNIEKVHIDGWECVSKKGEFNQGDLCVYFEIDSFLPIREEFEFLRKSSFKKMGNKEGFRLKTIRLKGELSQGLALPTSILNDLGIKILNSGDDISDDLGVIKFDPPIPDELNGIAKGQFPSFIRKTDQERVQNIWNNIKELDETFEVTLKLDGMSCTYYIKDGIFGVCSRNFELEENEKHVFWKLAREYKIEESLKEYGRNIALQGEIIGEGINGNPHEIEGQYFFLFDIFDINDQKYLYPFSRRYVNRKFFSNIKHATCFRYRSLIKDYKSLNDILEEAENCLSDKWIFIDKIFLNEKLFRSKYAEGLVFKSNVSKLTFKVISNKYLLKNK